MPLKSTHRTYVIHYCTHTYLTIIELAMYVSHVLDRQLLNMADVTVTKIAGWVRVRILMIR